MFGATLLRELSTPSASHVAVFVSLVVFHHDRLGMFLLILLLEVIAALAVGMMISAAAATPELALGIGIPATIISFVFAGFYSKSAYLCLGY
jgi:hypothetical protein